MINCLFYWTKKALSNKIVFKFSNSFILFCSNMHTIVVISDNDCIDILNIKFSKLQVFLMTFKYSTRNIYLNIHILFYYIFT
jgi:hypothetical protein